MPIFIYKAKREDGTPYEGEIEATNRFEVYGLVRKEGNTIVSVQEKKKGLSFNIQFTFLSRVKEHDKIIFARNLGAMLAAGLSMSRALAVMERQARSAKLKEVLKGLQASIEKGDNLSKGMETYGKVFPAIMIAMVRAGEESGTLTDTLSTMADQLEKTYELKKRIKGAMIYPGIIVTVLGIVGALMLIFIVPTLTSTFEDMNVELPVTTQFIIALSDFMVNNTYIALIVLVLIGGGFYGGLKSKSGRRAFEFAILHVPVIGDIVREVNAARTGRTLSSLLSSGVSIVQALDITGEVVQNSYFREVIAKAKDHVQKGSPLSKTFMHAEKLYPPLVGELMAVGDETGKISDMLKEVAQYYEKEVEQKTKNMSTIIEPFLMVIVGGAVGFFAVSMISPIYSITNSIQ